jgi:hypothetical protein
MARIPDGFIDDRAAVTRGGVISCRAAARRWNWRASLAAMRP